MGTAFRVKTGKECQLSKRQRRLPASTRWTGSPQSPIFKPNPTKLRPSITPGTVLIVLSGKFRGKRVVFLKQLDSGLLLVTGPYKLNGVPLRRMNQAYVIATSTKVNGDVSGVAKNVTDKNFAKAKAPKSMKSSDEFFSKEEESTKKELPEEFKALQKTVDAALVPLVKKTEFLDTYLKTTFTL